MDVMEAIVGRRQIKQFKPDPIDMDQLKSWLEAASYAPNHRMNQPWQILVIGEETRAKLNHKANFGDAPVVLAFVCEPGKTPVDRDENLVAVAAFIQNFCLAAHAAGAGTRWTSIGSTENGHEVLGLGEGYEAYVLGVGYPHEVPAPKHHTPIEEKMKHLP
ncbi:nitroreductase family protein [Alicyclobacillus dauci]|uniref:Nitroreductase family protein n=1 Tax=Alicyclobacillus dauci TaxID=1475485 RepID=A0ABY6Z0Y9_9BACL|nr:nitroreductase family protein [Alicyclobacillus dauci]WAH36544.1 nitroreductase family protein [Alicyclobacillus dauci]